MPPSALTAEEIRKRKEALEQARQYWMENHRDNKALIQESRRNLIDPSASATSSSHSESSSSASSAPSSSSLPSTPNPSERTGSGATAEPDLAQLLSELHSRIGTAVTQRMTSISSDELNQEEENKETVQAKWNRQIIMGRINGLPNSVLSPESDFIRNGLNPSERAQILTCFVADILASNLKTVFADFEMNLQLSEADIDGILAPLRNSQVVGKDEIVDNAEVGKRISDLVAPIPENLEKIYNAKARSCATVGSASAEATLLAEVATITKEALRKYLSNFSGIGYNIVSSLEARLARSLVAIADDQDIKTAIDAGLFERLRDEAEHHRITEELQAREIESREIEAREIERREKYEERERLRKAAEQEVTKQAEVRRKFRAAVDAFPKFQEKAIKARISAVSSDAEKMKELKADAGDLPDTLYTPEHFELLTFDKREALPFVFFWVLLDQDVISEDEMKQFTSDNSAFSAGDGRNYADIILKLLDRIHDYCVLNDKISASSQYFKSEFLTRLLEKFEEFKSGDSEAVTGAIDSIISKRLRGLKALEDAARESEQAALLEVKREEKDPSGPSDPNAPSAFETKFEELVSRDRRGSSGSIDIDFLDLEGDIDGAMEDLMNAYFADTEKTKQVKDESSWLSRLFKKDTQKPGWVEAGHKVDALLKKFRQRINETRVQKYIFGQLDMANPIAAKVKEDWEKGRRDGKTVVLGSYIGRAYKDGDSVLTVDEAKRIYSGIVEQQHSETLASFEKVLQEGVKTGAIVPKKSGMLSFLKFIDRFRTADRKDASPAAAAAEEQVIKQKTQAMVNSAMLRYEIDKMANAGHSSVLPEVEELLLEQLGYKARLAGEGTEEEKEAKEREVRATRNQAQANILREMLKVLMDEDALGKQSVDKLEERIADSKLKARLIASKVPPAAANAVSVIVKTLDEMLKDVREKIEPQKAKIEKIDRKTKKAVVDSKGKAVDLLPKDFPKLQRKSLLNRKARWMDEEVNRVLRESVTSISEKKLKNLLRQDLITPQSEKTIATEVRSLMANWDAKFLNGEYSRKLDLDRTFRKRKEFFKTNRPYLTEEVIQGLDNDDEILGGGGVCFGMSNTWAREDLEAAVQDESKRDGVVEAAKKLDKDLATAKELKDKRTAEAREESRSGGVTLAHRVKQVIFKVGRSGRFKPKENWKENKADPGKPYRENFYRKDILERYGFEEVETPVTTNLSENKDVTAKQYRESFVKDLLKAAESGKNHGVFVISMRREGGGHAIEAVIRPNGPNPVFQLSDPNIGRFNFPDKAAFENAFLDLIEWYPNHFYGLAYQFKLAKKNPADVPSKAPSKAPNKAPSKAKVSPASLSIN